MSDIKCILKDNIENFQSEYDKMALKLEEKEEEYKNTWIYAGYLKKSVKEKQILFWCKGYLACADTPRYLFEQLYKTFGNAYKYIWVVKAKKWIPKDLPTEVKFVVWESAEYWEALACSKYLIGNVLLPMNFVKRKEQIYVNTLLGIDYLYRKDNAGNQSAQSQIWLEQLKTDYLIADSEWMLESLYKQQLNHIYQGKVILTGSVRAEYMRKKAYTQNEKMKCLFLIRNKDTHQWFQEHLEEFKNPKIEIKLIRDQNCAFEGKDICDYIAESDLLVSDRSNYMRDAAAYGCKVCCFKESEDYIGFEEYETIANEAELKVCLSRNGDFRRKSTQSSVDVIKLIMEAVFCVDKNTEQVESKRGDGEIEEVGLVNRNSYIKSLNSETKKVIWVLTDWKLPREKQYIVKRALEHIDTEKYEVVAAALATNDVYVQEELEKLPEYVRKINYRGKMVLTKEENIYFRLMEKNPALLLEHTAVSEYAEKIMEREWKRKWGNPRCDVMVLFAEKMRQYMVTVFQEQAQKVLVAEEPLALQKEKNLYLWQELLGKFDTIYISPFEQEYKKEILGAVNQEKIQIQELLFAKETIAEEQMEYVELSGEKYILADHWKLPMTREQMYLVKVLEPESYVVNMDLPPNEERKVYLKEFLADKKHIVVFGRRIDDYKKCLPHEYEVLDKFSIEKLYMLPVAKHFFANISTYIGDKRLEEDVFEQISQQYNIKFERI